MTYSTIFFFIILDEILRQYFHNNYCNITCNILEIIHEIFLKILEKH